MPIKKNKLFFFISYQHVHDADEEIGISRTIVPAGLTDDRSPAAIAALVNGNFPAFRPTVLPYWSGTAPGDINPIAYALLNYKLPNGQFLIPSANGSFTSDRSIFPKKTFTPGHCLFHRRSGRGRPRLEPEFRALLLAQVLLPA